MFIHSDQYLRIVARFRESQFVSSYRRTVEDQERGNERERCWSEFRAGTINSPERSEFDRFWEKQDSIRSLIILDNFVELQSPPQFKDYGKALEWGYPTSVGWRPLDLFQTHYLMHLTGLDVATVSFYLGAVLK